MFVNSGAYSITDNSGLTSTSISFANNVYAGTTSVYRGTKYTDSTWSAIEPSRIVAMPTFVSHSSKNLSNDLHLASGDAAAVNRGLNFTGYAITTDKDGVPRPATGPWDDGAYELASGGGAVLPTPTVRAGPDQSITLPTSTLALVGNASDPVGQSLTVACSQLSGPGTVAFGSASSTITSAIHSPTGLKTVRFRGVGMGLEPLINIRLRFSHLPQANTH